MNFQLMDPSLLSHLLPSPRDVKVFLFSEDVSYRVELSCSACMHTGSPLLFHWANVQIQGCGSLLRKIIWSTHRNHSTQLPPQ